MKTQSVEKIKLAEELADILKQKSNLEKRENELKAYFKNELENKPGVLEAGNVMIIVDQKNRSGLDRTALETKFSVDVIRLFEKTTQFLTISVRKT